MKKIQYDLKKLLTPRDVFIAIVILIGLFFLIVLPEIEVKLIGASIAVLGIIFFVIDISNRIKNYIDLAKPGEQPPDFETVKVKKDGVIRTIYKDYIDSFGDTKDYIEDRLEEENKYIPDDDIVIKESIKPKVDEKIEVEVKQETVKDETSQTYKTDFIDDGEITIISKNVPKPVVATITEDFEIPQEQKAEAKEELFKEINLFEQEAPVEEKAQITQAATFIQTDIEEKQIPSEEPVKIEEKKQERSPYKKSKIDVPVSLFKDDSIYGNEPLEALQFLLNRILTIIRSVTNTKTAVFLLVDQVNQNFLIISSVSDNSENIRKEKLIPIGQDIISQIYIGSSPEILTEINLTSVTDLIPYYKHPTDIGSFIGVPVFYDKSVHGILCADSEVKDAYNTITVNFLGHFTRIISALFKNYLEKHDLNQSQRLLEAINLFRQKTNQNYSLQSISDSIAEVACRLIEYTSFGVCLFDFYNNNWTINTYVSKSTDALNIAGKNVSIENSLIAPSIISSQTVLHNNLNEEYLRTCDDEYQINTNYSFLSVPIKSYTTNYGAIFLEINDGRKISQNSVSILETLGEQSAMAIEMIYYDKLIKNSQLIDPNTGILNIPAFIQRFREELERSRDFGIKPYLCVFQLDKYSSLDPQHHNDRLQKAINHVLNLAKSQIRIYDIIGNIADNTYAIALFGISLQEARIWAERLRSEIAISVLEIMSQRFTVTISLGLTQVKESDTIDDIINNAGKALSKSLKKTNAVTVN